MLAFSLPDSGVRIYEINIAKGVKSWLSKLLYFMAFLPIGNILLFWEISPILQLCTHSKNSNFCSFKNLSQFQKSDIYFWVNAYVVHTADMQILLFEEIHSVLNINQHNCVALILHLWPMAMTTSHYQYITYPKKAVWMLKAWKTRKYTGLNHLQSASALFRQVHPFRVKMIIKESSKRYLTVTRLREGAAPKIPLLLLLQM